MTYCWSRGGERRKGDTALTRAQEADGFGEVVPAYVASTVQVRKERVAVQGADNQVECHIGLYLRICSHLREDLQYPGFENTIGARTHRDDYE